MDHIIQPTVYLSLDFQDRWDLPSGVRLVCKKTKPITGAAGIIGS